MPSRSWWLLLLLISAGCSAATESQRYRGDYTYGHEVNIFCPQINAQCYWLGPDTNQVVRAELKALYEEKSPGLYKPVCVVIEGKIDRDSARSGFAADFGERLFVEVSEACRKLSGFAVLDDNRITFDRLEVMQLGCDTGTTVEPLFTQGLSWQVSLAGPQALLLANSRVKLGFKKRDWR
jgi:hypothetical protein